MIYEQAIPWELIGGGGVGLTAIVIIVLMLRNSNDNLRNSNETIKTIVTQFASTVEDANNKNKQNVDTFTETTATLVREARVAHEKCEDTLHQILRDHLIPRPSRKTDPQ